MSRSVSDEEHCQVEIETPLHGTYNTLQHNTMFSYHNRGHVGTNSNFLFFCIAHTMYTSRDEYQRKTSQRRRGIQYPQPSVI